MKSYKYFGTYFIILTLATLNLFAQDKEANITLKFEKEDTLNICKAFVTSDELPVKEISVKLYVQRLFSLLPVGDGTTDDEGMVSFEFPKDIPGDNSGTLTVIAKIEDDENYANTEAKNDVKWGLVKTNSQIMERSLSGSRSNAPIYFIVIANLIIFGIWGTLVYVVLQLFKIRKISRHLHNQITK